MVVGIVVGIIMLLAAAALVKVQRVFGWCRVGKWEVSSRTLLVPAVALVLAGALFLSGVFSVTGATRSTAAAAPKSPDRAKSAANLTSSDISQQVIDALTVQTVRVNCVDVVKANGGATKDVGGQTYVVSDVGALKGTPPRVKSDDLSTPLSGSNPDQQLSALQATFCQDPLVGTAWANMYGDLSVDGVAVRSLNPWLNSFLGSPQQKIAAQASQYVVLDSMTQQQKAAAAAKYPDWQQFAELLGTLTSRFQIAGDKALPSVKSWHLAGGGLAAGTLPSVEISPHPDNLPALVLQVTAKGCQAPLAAIGANLQDRRPEEFASQPCNLPAPVTPPAVTPGPPPPHGTTPPPHGTTPPPHGTTPPPHGTTPPTTTPRTTPPTSPTTAPPPTTPPTTTKCPSGKCVPATTTPPPPVTAAPQPTSPTTTQGSSSGWGATSTTTPPTTVAPAPAPPTTDSPPGTAAPPPTV